MPDAGAVRRNVAAGFRGAPAREGRRRRGHRGGAVGAACARAAAARGLQVAIFEPGPDPAAASPASAGMLAAQIEPTDDALVGLSVRARDLYEPLAPALGETTGIDIGFWRAGIAAGAIDHAAADRLQEDVARPRHAGV